MRLAGQPRHASGQRDRHRAYLIGSRIAAAAISAVWMVVAARLLDLRQFADLALGAALSAIAVQVADVGVGIQLPQVFANPESGFPIEAVRQALRRRLATGLATAPVLVAAFVLVASNGALVVAAGFAASTIATSVYSAGYVALRSMNANRAETLLEPAGRALVLGMATAVAASGGGLGWIAWSYALADVVVLAAIMVVLARKARGAIGGKRLGPVTWLAAAGPIGMVYWRVDMWLLAAVASSRQVALYGSAYRLLDAAVLPVLVISQLFPAPFARCEDAQRSAFVRRWVAGSILLVAPFAAAALVFGRPLLTVLFGQHFAGATPALALLGLAAPLTAAVFILTTALATLDPRSYIGVAAAALCLNVLGNVALAPTLGATGAAAATVMSQAFLGAALALAVRRRLSTEDRLQLDPAIPARVTKPTVMA